jgi:hypothetical protein
MILTETKMTLAHRIIAVPCRTSYIFYLNILHTSSMENECFVCFVVEFVVSHTLRPIVTFCIISGGCRLNGGTSRLNFHDRGSYVDQNANSHPCYIKTMLHIEPLAEGKELCIAERLFPRDLRFSQRRCCRL